MLFWLACVFIVAAVVWIWWVTAPMCPRCGAARSKAYPHTRKDGQPDRRFSHNPLTCRSCGHEGDAVSRSTYKELVAARSLRNGHGQAKPAVKATTVQRSDLHDQPVPSSLPPRQWYPGTKPLTVAGRQLAGCLLYVIDGQHDAFPTNPSTILRDAPVGKATLAGELGYWPTYANLTPHQRAGYLDWLATGRKNPEVDLGYVFLYFYGLEWRALVDNQDHVRVGPEVFRLYKIYGRNRSFHQYASNLLGALLLHAGRTGSLDAICNVCADTGAQHGGIAPLLLDGIIRHHAGKDLPKNWAFEIAMASGAFRKGVAIERHRELFDPVFARRFDERYPNGIPLPEVHAPVEVPYRWALPGAPLTNRTISTTGLLIGDSQKKRDLAGSVLWQGLKEVWTESIKEVLSLARAKGSGASKADEVRSYRRAADASEGVRTANAEPIPNRPVTAAALDPLATWFAEEADEEGLVKAPLAKLCSLTVGGTPEAMTARQQVTLLESLQARGYAVEPDNRPSCSKAPGSEIRYVFRPDQPVKEPSVRNRRVRTIVEAAMVIASSDGSIDEGEVEEIIVHIDEKDSLTPLDRQRLRWYCQWLQESGKIDRGFNRLKKAALPQTHRKAIASLSLAIILRDGVVSDGERKAIARLYAALELPDRDLDALLKPANGQTSGIIIDWDAVAKLQAETLEVQDLLADVLTDEPDSREDPSETSSAASTGEEATADAVSDQGAEALAKSQESVPSDLDRYPGLEPRAARVLCAIATQTEISSVAFRALCKDAGLLPSATIDVINEWSDVELGDRCIEGDGPYQIATNLLT